MITYKDGNAVDAVLDGEAHILLHVANCQGVMGSGIAKEVKAKIPSAYDNYKESSHKLGQVSRSDCYKVFNLHAQEFYGYDRAIRYLSYKALVSSLQLIETYDFLLQDEFKSSTLRIAIPYKMGSDRAGGDWDTVLEIVDAFLGHHEIIVYKL